MQVINFVSVFFVYIMLIVLANDATRSEALLHHT